MITLNDAFYTAREKLTPQYGQQEATAIAHEVLEDITGLKKMDRLFRKDEALTKEQEDQWQMLLADLERGRPLQYATGKAYFMGYTFTVNEYVLIPRPETEELVDWIVTENGQRQNRLSILEIGSGSGCIATTLKKLLPDSLITSCDISREALKVARMNAAWLQADVTWIETDFLDEKNWEQFGEFDLLVSNPPYIPAGEKESIDKHVKDFEPETALFVPDNDPLLFYRKMAHFGQIHLKSGGSIYCETHRDYAADTELLFREEGYTTSLRQDLHGNNRMIRAVK